MEQFDYLIPFVGIIYGLSATDLLNSLYRLIVERHEVKFNILPFLWAIIAFLLIINGWWGFMEINQRIDLQNAGHLLVLSILPLLAFLVCSLSLPNKTEKSLDLRDYFEHQKTPLYLSFAAYFIAVPLIPLFFEVKIQTSQVIVMFGIAIVVLCLTKVRRQWPHITFSILLISSLIKSLFSQSIVI